MCIPPFGWRLYHGHLGTLGNGPYEYKRNVYRNMMCWNLDETLYCLKNGSRSISSET